MATAAGSASLGDLIPKFSLSASKRLSSSDLLLGVSGSAFADSGRAPSTVLKRVGGGGAVCARVLGAVGGGAGDGHGNVDDDAIAFLDADRFEAVGNLAGFSQQFAVGNACDFTAVGFKNEGGFIA